MTEKRRNIVLRFGLMYALICVLFVGVIYRIVVLQFIEREEWLKVAEKQKRTDIIVKPNRGNIFSADGRLMASSIPSYYVYMDMRVPALNKDSGKLFYDKIDSVSQALSVFFGDKTAQEYKEMLVKGFEEKKPELKLYPKRISYAQLKELRKLPLFCMGNYKSGLLTKEMLQRVKPFGSLASRTIGDIYADEQKGGKNGLELYFNKDLVGIPGLCTRRKVANRYQDIVQVEPIDGIDIVSTIDIDFQDIAEKALVDSLKSYDAETGYAVLMEVKSGEVKAIVNMQKNEDGTYTENRNGAVSDKVEPGSTFKVISLMAVLDDGRAKLTDTIHTGNGIWYVANKPMRDHNANRGGYGTITLAEAIHASSNVGISKTIMKAYGAKPSEFVEKLYRMKIADMMNLEIPGTAKPLIKHPKKNPDMWYKTTLAWMSVGYETMMPPIYTLAFYNSIANNGVFVRPRFVKALMKNGQVLKTFEPDIINPAICKPSTIKDLKEVLLGVVEGKKGTAHNVKSNIVRIAGKTGTAQISKGKQGYKAGGKTHQLSFCGYFPADNPQYSCIVVIREPHRGAPSGGKMAGSVFKSIAEQVMLKKSEFSPADFSKDSTLVINHFPEIKPGLSKPCIQAMNLLNVKHSTVNTEWVKPELNDSVQQFRPLQINTQLMPDLKGMGAKDALYLLNSLGLKAHISGRGKVISQNLNPGAKFTKGQSIQLVFDN